MDGATADEDVRPTGHVEESEVSLCIKETWTHRLDVFVQEFDTAMAIWRLEDPAIDRLCWDEPPLTRGRIGDSQIELSQGLESVEHMLRPSRKRRRKTVKGDVDRETRTPRPPVSSLLQFTSGDETQETETLLTQTQTQTQTQFSTITNSEDAMFTSLTMGSIAGESVSSTGTQGLLVDQVAKVVDEQALPTRRQQDPAVSPSLAPVSAVDEGSREQPISLSNAVVDATPQSEPPSMETQVSMVWAQDPFDCSKIQSGFQTGHGQTIGISKKRLQEFQAQLWDDTDVSSSSHRPTIDGNNDRRETLDTVANDRSFISTRSFVNGGSLITSDGSQLISKHSQIGESRPVASFSSGFQTGSGKSLAISRTSLERYQALLFNDEVGDKIGNHQSVSSNANYVSDSMNAADVSRRSTSEGNDFAVASKSEFEFEHSRTTADQASPQELDMVQSAFMTGSGKHVAISKSRLQEYESRSVEENGNANSTSANPSVQEESSTIDRKIVSGFTTGSGKQVKVSERSLARYRESLADEGRFSHHDNVDARQVVGSSEREDPSASTSVSNHQDEARTAPDLGSSLFQTAGGRDIKISPERLKEFEAKLFEESVQSSLPVSVVEAASATIVPKPAGFQTGSGRCISISPEKLQQYEKMLFDDTRGDASVAGSDPIDQIKSTEPTRDAIAAGFQTGSGRQVMITQQKLQEYAEKIRSDSENDSLKVVGTHAVFMSVGGVEGLGLDVHGSSTLNSSIEEASQQRIRPNQTSSARRFSSVHERSDSSQKTVTFSTRRHSLPAYGRGSSSHSSRSDGGTGQNPRPPPLEDISNRSTQPRMNGLGSKWRPPRLQGKSYLTPSKEQASQVRSQSLSGKKRFRPPIPSKTPPKKALTSPDKKEEQKSEQSSRKVMVYREAMRISLQHLVAASALDTLMIPAGHRTKQLRLIDALKSIDVKFQSDSDGEFFVAPHTSIEDAQGFVGVDKLFDLMVSENYFGEEKDTYRVWFHNQYRWIVWKLARRELEFPRFLLGKYLTRSQVMFQICHRFERDVLAAQRSVLKKILNRDANSASCMVLLVAGVIPFPADQEKNLDIIPPPYWKLCLVLTDGWYGIHSVPDEHLCAQVWKLHQAGCLVGRKIVMWNASLQNVTDGVDPLECALATGELSHPLGKTDEPSKWPYLQLHHNSTRPAAATCPVGVERLVRDDSLGKEQQYDFYMLKSLPMRTLEVGGGMVRSVRVMINRISPFLHLQPKDYTIGPRILCEEQMSTYLQLRQDLTVREVSESTNCESGDVPVNEQPLPVPFIKLDVVCTHDIGSGSKQHCRGVLTLWRPSEDVRSRLHEGQECFVNNVSVNWKIDSGGCGVFLRLGTTKGSVVQHIKSDESRQSKLHSYTGYRPRECQSIEAAASQYQVHYSSHSSEERFAVDVCVVILHVEEQPASVGRQGDQVLTDHVFVTDTSLRVMSIRVPSTLVKREAAGNNSRVLNRVFRRGNKKLWQEGSIVSLSGLVVSHFDHRLDLLDCELVESSQIFSLPSKKSPFFEAYGNLRDLVRNDSVEGLAFRQKFDRLKRHVQRQVLQLEGFSSQEDADEDLAFDEADRLTQELSAHPEDALHWMSQPLGITIAGTVVKLVPLPQECQCFYVGAVAIAYVKRVDVADDCDCVEPIYLTGTIVSDMLDLVGSVDPHTRLHDHAVSSIDKVFSLLEQFAQDEVGSKTEFRFETNWETSERILNSCRSWERENATFILATSISKADGDQERQL